MESRRRIIVSLILIFCCTATTSAVSASVGCNVTRKCNSWTHNECAPKPLPKSTASLLLRPSPGIDNSTYAVCPVVSRWNISEETRNLTHAVKEARLFLNWLCENLCNNATNRVRKTCIDTKLTEYRNNSTPRASTVMYVDRESLRQAIYNEMQRLDRIATQKIDYEKMKRRVDGVASNMGINITMGSPNATVINKDGIIRRINNLTLQINSARNTSLSLLKSFATNYDIRETVRMLEKRFGTRIQPSMSSLDPRGAMNATVGMPRPSHMSMMITPSPASASSIVYASSCFVLKSHCRMETKCPGQTMRHTMGHSMRPSMAHSMRPSMGHSMRPSMGHSMRPSMGHPGLSSAMRMSLKVLRSEDLGSTRMRKMMPSVKPSHSLASRPIRMSSVMPTRSSKGPCIYDCAKTCNGTKKVDCQKFCGGNATIDDCGKCTGGTTGHKFNFAKDCAGVCNGRSVKDSCNVCEKPSGKNGSRHLDCNGTCFGSAVIDRCGQCVGGLTGKKPAVPDACGVYCNGDNSTCSGCDGVPNSGKVVDACGVCGGDGSSCTTIVKIVPYYVTNAGRNVTVMGAGLNGSRAVCIIGNSPVNGIIVNITSIICPIPAKSPGATSLRMNVTKRSGTMSLGPLQMQIYAANSLTFTSLSPTEQLKKTYRDVTIHGTGFVQTNMSLCQISNSSHGKVRAVYINNTAIKCKLPTMKPGRYGIRLHLNGHESLPAEVSQEFIFEIFAAPPMILSARFSNSGSMIIVKFTKVRPLITDVSRIFTANVTSSLGLVPRVSWIGKGELRIATGKNASILPGHYLVLKTNVFKSLEYSKYASGSVVLLSPRTPLLPLPVIKGPTVISSCSNLTLSADQSSGSGGRPLSFTWTVVTNATNKAAIQTLLDGKKKAKIKIAGSKLTPNTDYTFTVSVKNFLNRNVPRTVSHTFKKASSPIPELAIKPSSNPKKVLAGSDFFLVAKLAVSSCSSNYTAVFRWTSPDATLSASSSFITSKDKQTLVIKKDTLTAGRTYTVNLRVSWSHDSSIYSDTKITLNTELRPLIAAIVGGDFSIGMDAGSFTLNAKRSFDPDQVDKSLKFNWACVDTVTDGNCISQTRKNALAIASKSVVVINPKELKERAYKFTVNVTSLSSGRWAAASATVTIKGGVIPKVFVKGITKKVRPGGKLAIRANIIVRNSATATWSAITTEEGSSSIDFTSKAIFITPPTFKLDVIGNSSAFFVLKPGALQAGAKYTLRLTIKDGAKEGFGQTSFEVYDKPTPGEFAVTPTNVVALSDITMEASLWTISSDCSPLKYVFGTYVQSKRFTSYSSSSDPTLTVPASLGWGTSKKLDLAVRVHSACGTMTEMRLNITSTKPANISSVALDGSITKARKAASSGDLATAMASFDSLMAVTSGGDRAALKKVEKQALSTVLSLSKSLPKTGSVSSSLLGVLKKVDPKKLDTKQDLESISEAYVKVLDGMVTTDISDDEVGTVLDNLADIDDQSGNTTISKNILNADKSLAKSLASKTGPGQLPFETTGAKKRVLIRVAHSKLDQVTKNKGAAGAVEINFGKQLSDKYKEWPCSTGGTCEGVVVKMRSYAKTPLMFNDSRLASSGTQVIDIALSNPETGDDLAVSSLTTPISFNMTVDEPKPGFQLKCVHFNTVANKWEDSGMKTKKTSKNVVQCESTHLTAFAVITDPVASSSQVPVQTPGPSSSYDTFSVSFILTNRTWNASLADSTSSEYSALKTEVRNWINGVFASDSNYYTLTSAEFSLSSPDKIQAKIAVQFTSGTTTATDIDTKLKSGNGNGGFHIDASSLAVTKTQQAPTPTEGKKEESSKAVLLAIIFGILGALILVVVIVLVVRAMQKRSKVHTQGQGSTGTATA